jgi:hypothetical protein
MSYNYRQDIHLVNELVQDDCESFKRSLLFVLATIQQQLETVPRILSDFEYSGSSSGYAFGSKREGIDYINDNYLQLWSTARGVVGDPEQLLSTFLQVPGLGLAKSGFAAQLFSNKVGCLDTQNLKLDGVPLGQLRYPKHALLETRVEYINRYADLCRGLGGSVKLWSAWCHYLYQLRPGNWASGGEVSYFHYQVIAGEIDYREDVLYVDIDDAPLFLQKDWG